MEDMTSLFVKFADGRWYSVPGGALDTYPDCKLTALRRWLTMHKKPLVLECSDATYEEFGVIFRLLTGDGDVTLEQITANRELLDLYLIDPQQVLFSFARRSNLGGSTLRSVGLVEGRWLLGEEVGSTAH